MKTVFVKQGVIQKLHESRHLIWFLGFGKKKLPQEPIGQQQPPLGINNAETQTSRRRAKLQLDCEQIPSAASFQHTDFKQKCRHGWFISAWNTLQSPPLSPNGVSTCPCEYLSAPHPPARPHVRGAAPDQTRHLVEVFSSTIYSPRIESVTLVLSHKFGSTGYI